MLHFGLLGSSMFKLLYTAAAVFMAACLLWLSPWLEHEAQYDVYEAPLTAEDPLEHASNTTVQQLSATSTPQAHADTSSLNSTTKSSQLRENQPINKGDKSPRRSFSFHYLDILEWLFARKPDPSSVRPPASTLGRS